MGTEPRLPAGHTGDNRPPRYVDEDGTIVYRASGWKTCDVAFANYALGVEPSDPPEFLRKAWDQGNEYEPVVLGRMQQTSLPLLSGGVATVRVEGRDDGEQWELDVVLGESGADGEGERIVARCHPDALGTASWFGAGDVLAANDVPVVVEVKALGKTYWSKFKKGGYEAVGLYDHQLAIQMHATKRPLLFVCGEKLEGGGIGEVVGQLVTVAPVAKSRLRIDVARRERIIAETIERGVAPECETNQYPCPFWFLHTDEPAEGPRAGNAELVGLVERERELDQAKKLAVDAHAAAKKALEAWLEGNAAKDAGAWVQVGDDQWDVTWVRQERAAYTVPAGKVEYVQVKKASKKTAAARMDSATGGTVDTLTADEVFDLVAGDKAHVEFERPARGTTRVSL